MTWTEIVKWVEEREQVEGLVSVLVALAGGPWWDYFALECDCCGGEGAISFDGMFADGEPLICGCDGQVSIDDSEEVPVVWVNAWDCTCGDVQQEVKA